MTEEPKPNPVLEAALEYAARGFQVMPIKAGEKVPACKHGSSDATCLEPIIRQWFKAADLGVGIAACGPARLMMIDIDGDEGRVSMAALEQQISILPPTATVRTPRGGEHRYFRVPQHIDINRIRNSASKLGTNIDTRGVGGYVVAPPTAGYTWVAESDIADLPDIWAERIIRLAEGGQRYGSAALNSACDIVRQAPEGQRNETLNVQAFSIGQLVASGTISEHVAREALVGAALTVGLTESESRKTIASGFRAGSATPRTPPVAALKPPEDFTHLLRYGGRGALSKDPSNALVLLTLAPKWHHVLGYDSFRDAITWTAEAPNVNGGPAPPKKGAEFTDHDATWLKFALARHHGVEFSSDAIWDAAIAAARRNSHNSLKEHLDSLRWDGAPRLNTWLSVYLGAEPTIYTSRVGRWWLISAIARVATPGCQVDHMLVLEGGQGWGKTTTCRLLGGDYYLGGVPDLRDKKAVAEILRGKWIVEIGELDALKGAESTRIKDFLTQTVDTYRPAYGRMSVTHPRTTVFLGSTNESEYLPDATGGRRFWPVRIERLDRDALARDRDQLLAEAVAEHHAGAPWWPEGDSLPMLQEQQEQRHQVDSYEPIIESWAKLKDEGFTMADLLGGALSVPIKEWTRATQTRVGAILHRLGYEVHKTTRNNARVRVYTKCEE